MCCYHLPFSLFYVSHIFVIQKTGNAIRALGRMACFQKALCSLGKNGNDESSPTSGRSRQNSGNSDSTTPTGERSLSSLFRSQKRYSEGTIVEHDSGIDSKLSEKDSVASSDDGKSVETGSELSKPDTPDINGKESPDSNIQEQAEEVEKGESAMFLKEMKDFEVFEGDSARFDVRVTGDPEPDVRWYKDGELIKDSHHYVIDHSDNGNCSLIIKHCREEDDATYECKAKNCSGEVCCDAELYVES